MPFTASGIVRNSDKLYLHQIERSSRNVRHAHKAIWETSDKTAYTARIAFTRCDWPLLLLLDAIHAFRDLMGRRKIAPIRKETEYVVQRHFIDLCRRVATTGHESCVDEAEIDAGGSITGTSPA